MGVGACMRVSVRQHCCMSLLKLELQMSHAGRAWLSVEPGNGGKALVKPTMEMQWWGEDLQVLYIDTLDSLLCREQEYETNAHAVLCHSRARR